MSIDELNTQKILINAVKNNDFQLLEKLIINGGDVNTCNTFEDSLLFTACEKGYSKIALFLIQNKADIYRLNKGNQSALHAACKGGNLDIVKVLINSGMDIKQLSGFGSGLGRLLPISLAFSYLKYEIIEYFVDNNLIEKDDFAYINYSKFDDENPLCARIIEKVFSNDRYSDKSFVEQEFKRLVSGGFCSCVRLMLERFPFIIKNINNYLSYIFDAFTYDETLDHLSYTNPLLKKHLFTEYNTGANPMLDVFFQHGLTMESLDNEGQTLLHYSAMEYDNEYEDFHNLKVLLDMGYTIDCRNARNQTPLQVAIEKGLFYHAFYLIFKGANVNAVDKDNKSVLDYAEHFITMGLDEADAENLELRADLVQLLRDYHC